MDALDLMVLCEAAKYEDGPRDRRKKRIRLGRSRQKKYGGGKFYSEKQRRYLWAAHPQAAHKWAHNQKSAKGDWE